jgi:hypothetical protein
MNYCVRNFMRHVSVALSIALFVGSTIALGQSQAQLTKEDLMNQVAGMCRNPDQTFPKSLPPEKRAAFDAYCSCIQSSINAIPENKLQQAANETLREYAEYKNDPTGFIPTGEYSLIRMSKACIRR